MYGRGLEAYMAAVPAIIGKREEEILGRRPEAQRIHKVYNCTAMFCW